jgi:DNA transformation protein and related proteins
MDNTELEDLFEAVAPVSIRRMFGGKGVYCDGQIIAIWLRDRMLLKGDAQAAEKYEAAGGEQWTYTHRKTGKPVKMPYWSLPESGWDDPDEMAVWARTAFEAALRSN